MKIDFKELSKRREQRLPGFMRKHVLSEYWKVFARLLLFKNTNLITYAHGRILILNIDNETYHNLKRVKGWSHHRFWSISFKNLFQIVAIYFPWLLTLRLKNFDEIYFSTDISIANYNILKRSKRRTKKICIQHGYFPKSHRFDIDGLNSDTYIVRSKSQANILLEAGYTGEIFTRKFKEKKFNDSQMIGGIVIVGPGFSHDRKLEYPVIELCKMLQNYNKLPIVYRPHPRCSNYLLTKLKSLNLRIDDSTKSHSNTDIRTLFIGYKSTMLIDAQDIGHKVILIRHPDIPEYFPSGEISIDVFLDSILEYVNEI
jgi:hypothetical protein